MRGLAGIVLALAAFDGPVPFLDRTGAALVGLALWAIADPLGGPRFKRPAKMSLPPKRVELGEPFRFSRDEELEPLDELEPAGVGRP